MPQKKGSTVKNLTLGLSLKLSGGVLDVHAESSENITTFRFFVFQMLTRWREPLLGLVLDSTFDNLATAVHRFTFISSQSFPMKCFGLDWFGFDWSAGASSKLSLVVYCFLERMQHHPVETLLMNAHLEIFIFPMYLGKSYKKRYFYGQADCKGGGQPLRSA